MIRPNSIGNYKVTIFKGERESPEKDVEAFFDGENWVIENWGKYGCDWHPNLCVLSIDSDMIDKKILSIRPITFKAACEFVTKLHRHNKPPQGHKFSIALYENERLVGVAMCGRPIARHFDDGYTIEVNRTCTDGTPNANSMLYGASWRASKAMGYKRIITYTQADESGISLKATGFVKVKELPARKSWAESSGKESRVKRDAIQI